MISYIKGKVAQVSDNSAVIDNNGIGYLISMPKTALDKLRQPVSSETVIQVYTYMYLKEDALSLFGFLTPEDKRVFELLIGVTGVGPKAALAILSILSYTQILSAIMNDDTDTLSKASGVGKKTAQRINLELRDKIKSKELEAAAFGQQELGSASQRQDAIDALLALGYTRAETVKTVMEVALVDMTAEQIIRLSLKKLAAR
jgi:Holliday junction DNA helicase RuvA